MNKKTYKKLTKYTLRMRLSSLKMTIKARLVPHYINLLNILAKVNLIKKHELCKSYTGGQVGPKSLPYYTTDRGVYDLSYFMEETRIDNELWWETKSGKRIYVIADSHIAETDIRFKVIPDNFNVLLPDHRFQRVDRPRNGEFLKILLHKPTIQAFNKDEPLKPLDIKTITLDFSRAMFKFSRKYSESLYERQSFNAKLVNSEKELHHLLESEKFEKEVNNILLRNI